MQPPAIDDAAVARRAYEKWERSERLHGSDQRDWFEAESELRRERQVKQADRNAGQAAGQTLDEEEGTRLP